MQPRCKSQEQKQQRIATKYSVCHGYYDGEDKAANNKTCLGIRIALRQFNEGKKDQAGKACATEPAEFDKCLKH